MFKPNRFIGTRVREWKVCDECGEEYMEARCPDCSRNEYQKKYNQKKYLKMC